LSFHFHNTKALELKYYVFTIRREWKLGYTYPETKTPVAKRKSKGREAPRISRVLSDLIAKRLGSGGLKFGGGVIETDVDDEVEVEEDVSVSDMALMQILFLGSSFVLENETGL
jgi:hypothetical protein